MKIGIIGSGVVAQALGAGFQKKGHQVMLGTREPAKLADWAAKNAPARVGSFSEAAGFADVAVLAVKGSVALEALHAAGPEHLAGKTVIDTTNPIKDAPPANGGVLQFFTSFDESLLERLQKTHPRIKFIKAFNSVGADLMIDPDLPGGPPTMFLCGNDAAAKRTVSQLIAQVGWTPDDRGPIEAARALEPLCILWCIPGLAKNDWRHAFKVLRY